MQWPWVLTDLLEPQFPQLFTGTLAPSLPEHLPRLPFGVEEKTHKFKCFINCENKTTLPFKSLFPMRVDYYF